jgi:hypothetical protein
VTIRRGDVSAPDGATSGQCRGRHVLLTTDVVGLADALQDLVGGNLVALGGLLRTTETRESRDERPVEGGHHRVGQRRYRLDDQGHPAVQPTAYVDDLGRFFGTLAENAWLTAPRKGV